jgi:hypothetical protein
MFKVVVDKLLEKENISLFRKLKRKISEKYGLDSESMNKISKILDHHTRFQKKMKMKFH